MDKARELAEKIAGAVEAGQELAGLSLHPLNRERMESLIREAVRPLVEALEHYAQCGGEGCTCGDGWDHNAAIHALRGIDGH